MDSLARDPFREDRRVTDGRRFPSRTSALEYGLGLFRMYIKQQPQGPIKSLTCVDISPLGPWLAEASAKDVAVLTRETPVIPPFDTVLFGVAEERSGAWELTLLAAQRSSENDFVSLSDLDEEGTEAVVFLSPDGRVDPMDREHFAREPLKIKDSMPQDRRTLLLCALAMFHVENVGMHEVPFPRHLRRRDKRETGSEGPRVYHTLTLRPFAEQEEKRGRDLPTGEVPLHLVRGHFARFTEQGKLFGKYVGTFWRPEHKAGNPRVGTVEKTYTLDPSPPISDTGDKT